MSDTMLNLELLPGNDCFACGHENPHGLQIEVTYDGRGSESLAGRFEPPAHATGFPGLTHGGALFSAMDCLATWVVVVFGPRDERYWLLSSADVAYRRAAPAGEPLRLTGRLAEQEQVDHRETLLVQVHIETEGGELVAEGSFREVPVVPERFRDIAGIDEIPGPWRDLFERGKGLPDGD